MIHILKAIFLRKKLLPLELVRFRNSICKRCPYRRRGWFRFYCKVCKCTVNDRRSYFNKNAHYDQACPKGYYETISRTVN